MKDLLFAMYMGGPDSIEAIRPFLKNLFSDRTIIDFKIGTWPQNILAGIIAKSRSKKVAPLYEKMGGSSPQLRHMKSVLEKTAAVYNEKADRELEIRTGMCYYHPYIEDVLDKLDGSKYDSIYVMTMYPQESYTTSGLCFKRFDKKLESVSLKGHMKRIPFWHLNEHYNRCLAARIYRAAEKLGKPLSECHLLYSAHSLPEYTVDKGDLYTVHLDEQIRYLSELLRIDSWSLAYQSRTGPVKWLGPETSTKLDELADEGAQNIIVVPISFVSDHIETLIELDEEYIQNIRQRGVNIVRTESLNDSDDFAESICNIILS
jgi:ferrochelatase